MLEGKGEFNSKLGELLNKIDNLKIVVVTRNDVTDLLAIVKVERAAPLIKMERLR